MDLHLLVAISNQSSALYGIRFISSFFGRKDGISVTLFCLADTPPAVWTHEKRYETLQQQETQAAAHRKHANAALNKGKAKLVELGFDPDRIQTKVQPVQSGKAIDIIQEGEKGLYDCVVLGRRGLSKFEEALSGTSVSRGLLCEKSIAPIWFCRRPEENRNGVMICADGSEPSLRIADHVGFIMSSQPPQRILLLHIRNGEMPQENFFAPYVALLKQNGIDQSMVENLIVDSKKPAQTILSLAETGKFAAVATGRSGAGGCSLRDIFFGSVSHTIFRDLTGASLMMSW